MLTEDALRDALSRHLARAMTTGGVNSMAVDSFDQGVDMEAALRLGVIYAEFVHERTGSPLSADEAAAMAFAAGVVVGRTARESEVTVEEVVR